MASFTQIKTDIDDAVEAAATVLDFVTKYEDVIPGASRFAPELAEVDKALHALQTILAEVP
jgi:hypothetical protein